MHPLFGEPTDSLLERWDRGDRAAVAREVSWMTLADQFQFVAHFYNFNGEGVPELAQLVDEAIQERTTGPGCLNIALVLRGNRVPEPIVSRVVRDYHQRLNGGEPQ